MVRAGKPVEELSARVLARMKPGQRMALLAEVPGLEEALRAAGVASLVIGIGEEFAAGGGSSLVQPLREFAPTHVALRAPASAEALKSLLAHVVDAVPAAEVMVWFSQAGTSTALLETLVGGGGETPRLAEQTAERCFAALGLRTRQRESFGAWRRVTSLAEETERALHSLLAQLQPSASGECLFYVLEAGAPAQSRARVSGLLSVLVLPEDGAPASAWDELLFSLCCQEYEALELIVVTRSAEQSRTLLPLFEQYQRLGPLRFQFVQASEARAVEAALEVARGQYLALVAPGWVVYPGHYARLIEALRREPAAWAVARALYAFTAPAGSGPEFIHGKRPFPLGERLELAHLREDPSLLYALVIDRERVGPFPLADGVLSSLPLRLGALFRPFFLAGIASCELRLPPGQEPRTEGPWPELQVLESLPRLEERVAEARAAGVAAKELRHRVVDAMNTRLREGLPWLHKALRRVSARRR